MLKKDDIFIDWSLWSVAGPIVLSILWFECGLSSNQISTNDARNVVLLVVDPSSIYHYIFWSDQYYHRVHTMVEVQWYGNADELLLSPLTTSLSPPWCCWTLSSVGNFWKHFLHASSWSTCLMKGVTSFDSRAFWCKLPSWIRESLFLLLWNHPKSVMHVRRILWSVRLIIFIPYVYPSTPSHWLSCSKIKESVQGELFGLPRVETSMSLMMVPPPELGSVLL